jgi:hypothetical protein
MWEMSNRHQSRTRPPSAASSIFFLPFDPDDISPEDMQRWPYYRYVSMRWPDYVQPSTVPIRPSPEPRRLETGERFDLNAEFRSMR